MSIKKLVIISSEPIDLTDIDNELTINDDGYNYNIINGELPSNLSMESCMKFIKNRIGDEGDIKLKLAYNELVNQLNINNI